MLETDVFFSDLITAIDNKTQWYDNVELPRLLSFYRELQVHASNVFQTLLKKGVISEDPYKHDKKISDIIAPDDTPFADSERSVVIGSRLSDYDNMLDFVCNYLKFSVDSINIDRIKRMIALNNCFNWTSLLPSSTKANTKTLAEMITTIRMGTDSIAVNVINDSVSHASTSISNINSILKDLTDFHKELYKFQIRKNILTLSDYPPNKTADATQEDAVVFIKRNFANCMRKQPYYAELVEELMLEDFSLQREERRKAVLAKLAVKQEVSKRKERKINPKDCLLDAVRTITAIVPQLEQIINKIDDNKKLLESENNSFFDKFKSLLRKAFNLKEPPVVYKILIEDNISQSTKQETIVYQDFITSIDKRCRYYSSFSMKNTPGYEKIVAMNDDKIFDFLSRQLSESQHLLCQLNGLDEFFKNAVQPLNRIKVKGIKMEITAIKNTLVKTNQRKAEYSAFVEEQIQLRKLGITNA